MLLLRLLRLLLFLLHALAFRHRAHLLSV